MDNMYLVLADGSVFKGKQLGSTKDTIGEVVFTTQMTGYLETLTDPSYYGQIVIQTFPLVGNYGVIPYDFECTVPHLSGYIVRYPSDIGSNFRSKSTLEKYLIEKDITSISNLDTRQLTRKIREYGVINGKITLNIDDIPSILTELKNYKPIDAIKSVTCKENIDDFACVGGKKVVIMDFGVKNTIIKKLNELQCNVVSVPSYTTSDEILNMKPDGILLSNGPGNPQDNPEIIKEIKKLTNTNIPIFGICMGHQLLALSQGGKTKKMRYGHRGANQPVRDTNTGKIYITSQNHGYSVLEDSIPENIGKMSFVNVNEDSCEGMEYFNFKGFSVQFHPEAAAGPRDTSFLFSKFVDMMGGK